MSNAKRWFKRTVLFLLISSALLLCAVFVDVDNATVKLLTNLGALLCWLFLILAYVMFYRFSKFRKAHEPNGFADGQRPGIIVFFSNPEAKKADIVMIVSFVISVALTLIKQIILGHDPTFKSYLFETVSVVSFAVFIFALQMHAILNGVNYKYYLTLSE